MSGLVYVLDGQTGLPTKHFGSYDPSNLAFTSLPDFPGPHQACGQLAWDGAYIYAIGSDGILYRYRPSTNTWSGPLLTGLNASALISDGALVYIVDGSANTVTAYNPVSGQTLAYGVISGGGGSVKVIWDFNTTLYVVRGDTSNGGSFTLDKVNLLLGTTQNGYPYTGYPGSFNGCAGGGWDNGVLCLITAATQVGTTMHLLKGTDNGTTMAFTDTVAPVIGAQGPVCRVQIDPQTCWVDTNNGGADTFNFNLYTPTISGFNRNHIQGPACFTYPIQSSFVFLESDGITPQNAVDPIGGATALFYPSQSIAVIEYNLQSNFTRSDVVLTVNQDLSLPFSQSLQIANAPNGPWGSSVDMGGYAAGQIKPYYIRATLPATYAPGIYRANILASGT